MVVVTGLYRKGLVYLDVPIADADYIMGKSVFDVIITVCAHISLGNLF